MSSVMPVQAPELLPPSSEHVNHIAETAVLAPPTTSELALAHRIFREYDVYPKDAALSELVGDKTSRIAQANGIEQPQTYVIRDASPNAFTFGPYLFVHDGLFRHLTTHEEVEGVLAHELGHMSKEHTKQRVDAADSIIRNIGMTRGQETEADFFAADALDKAGMNPLGVVHAFNALHQYTQARATFGTFDITHGQADDRSLNLQEAFWLNDYRHLSDEPPTALNLAPAAFMPETDPHNMLLDYQEQSPRERLVTLEKIFRLDGTDKQGFSVEHLKRSARHHLEQLCQQQDPNLEPQEIKRLCEIVEFVAGRERQNVLGGRNAYRDVSAAWDAAHHPVLAQLGWHMSTEEQQDLALGLTGSYLHKRRLQGESHRISFSKLTAMRERFNPQHDPYFAYRLNAFILDTIVEEQGYYDADDLLTPELVEFLAVPDYNFALLDLPSRGQPHSIKVTPELFKHCSDNALAMPDDEFLRYAATIEGVVSSVDEVSQHFWTPGLTRRLKHIGKDLSLVEFIQLFPSADLQSNKALLDGVKTLYGRAVLAETNLGNCLAQYWVQPTLSLEPDEARKFIDDCIATYQELLPYIGGQSVEAFQATLEKKYSSELITAALATMIEQQDTSALHILAASPSVWADYSTLHTLPSVEQWENLCSLLVQERTLETFSPTELLDLVALGLLSEDIHVRMQVAAGAMREYCGRVSFDEAMTALFETYQHLPVYALTESIKYLIEEKAETIAELQQLEDRMRAHLLKFSDERAEELGKASLLDTIAFGSYSHIHYGAHRAHGLENEQLLHALLSTQETDLDLQRYLFVRWWQAVGGVNLADFDTLVRNAEREKTVEYWSRVSPEDQGYPRFDTVVQKLYSSNEFFRNYMLRKLLVGERGILLSRASQERFMTVFLDACLSDTESEAGKQLKSFIQAFFVATDGQLLYQYLRPVLLGRLLLQPERPVPIATTAQVVSMQLASQLTHRHNRRFERLSPFISQRLVRMMSMGHAPDKVNKATTDARLLGLFGDPSTTERVRAMEPLELMLLAGEKSGSLGIRMLQLAGQYFTIPDEYKERYAKVYDANESQSRLQAFRVLKREAETSPEIATLLSSIATFGRRIGGGSLMSVYEVTLHDGSVEAVAIKNPNAEYHVSKMTIALRNGLRLAQRLDGSTPRFALVESMLDDVQQWINDELHDARFPEKDARFRLQNDSRLSGEAGRYQLFVPDTQPTGTSWVRREAFVAGKNLTSLQISDGATDIASGRIAQDDYKTIVSTITKNYLQQIRQGLVHSDIHAGNFRVLPDNQHIAIFDRYNLIELHADDIAFLNGLIGTLASGQAHDAVSQTMAYLLQQPENSHVQTKAPKLTEQLQANIDGAGLDTAVSSMIVALKQSGVHVPLKLSLILKNFLAIHTMSKQAGFGNLLETMFWPTT